MPMRNRLIVLSFLIMLLIGGVAIAAPKWGLFEGSPIIRVLVNGHQIQGDVPAVNLKGRAMVPLRFVSEALGATVGWNERDQTATVTTGTGAAPVIQSSLIRVMVASEKVKGAPTKTGEEFQILNNPDLYLYFEAWDDGARHSWTVKWTSKEGRVFKDATIEPTKVADGDVAARIYGYDNLRLHVPLARDQALLPDAGVFYATLYRDGVEAAKLPFWLKR